MRRSLTLLAFSLAGCVLAAAYLSGRLDQYLPEGLLT